MNAYETLKAKGNLLRPKPAPKKNRKFLRRASPKREQQNKEYLKLRKEFLAAHPWCQVCSPPMNNRSRDIHHKAGRGKNLLAVETWMAVCRSCHDWIHKNPANARALGYLE